MAEILKVAVQMDPLEAVNIDADSTFAPASARVRIACTPFAEPSRFSPFTSASGSGVSIAKCSDPEVCV